MVNVLMIDETDNVATVLEAVASGTKVSVATAGDTVDVVVKDDIPYGHKFALTAIARGTPVRKYGSSIGDALSDIAAGEHVHMHNVAGGRLRGDASTRG